MKITYITHACLLIEIKGVKINVKNLHRIMSDIYIKNNKINEKIFYIKLSKILESRNEK